MTLEILSNSDLYALALACPALDTDEAHDESACLACQAWAVYESRGCPVLP